MTVVSMSAMVHATSKALTIQNFLSAALGVSTGRTSMEGAAGIASAAVELAASTFIGELVMVELEKDDVEKDDTPPLLT